ncbi:MAG: hypothetical protein HY727_11880 [Candidatus Rokubacteria bacterium]|nr:hypothetical protein [Candidatus Rokubacteria bacterium]
MIPEEFVPSGIRLRLGPILRFQRYRSVEAVAPPILEVAQEMTTLAEKLVDPRVVWLRRPIARVGGDSLTLENGPTFGGRCFSTHLAMAGEAVCFVATIGPALDARAAELTDGNDLLEALFLDTAGWLAIEETLRVFRARLRARVRGEGLRLSPRLGPGYLDWPLGEQASFFPLFDGTPLPVGLSEYCVMTPKKSISGLFGLTPAG